MFLFHLRESEKHVPALLPRGIDIGVGKLDNCFQKGKGFRCELFLFVE